MSDVPAQFTTTRFARGVKLTVQHYYNPLTSLQTAAGQANVQGMAENLGVCHCAWTYPFLGPDGADPVTAGVEPAPLVVAPFPMPPFQDLFNRTTLADPRYPVMLRDLSLSWDQQAERFGVTGWTSTSATALLTNCDMSRYDMTLRLYERQPSLLTSDRTSRSCILTLEIPGVDAWGALFERSNPIVLPDLNILIKPFAIYQWQIECPGLFSSAGVAPATVEQLALPSLNIRAAFVSPLTFADFNDNPPGTLLIQNIPTTHNGQRTGTTIAVSTPAADAIITGTDIQDAATPFDSTLRQGLKGGYGSGSGALADGMLAADRNPRAMLAFDSHYHMIVVPMWTGHPTTRFGDVGTAASALPYITAPWQTATMDRRVLPVPDNFVLHHAFAVWNVYSPPRRTTGGATWGTRPTSATYTQQVGISISTGWRGDAYLQQQVAFLSWTPAALGGFQVDQFDFNDAGTARSCYELLQVPIVGPTGSSANSWTLNDLPFYMGKGTLKTAARSNCGTLPAGFGGGARHVPTTLGRETVLEVRWQKIDATQGLNNAGDPQGVLIGQGGEWVILTGRTTVAA